MIGVFRVLPISLLAVSAALLVVIASEIADWRGSASTDTIVARLTPPIVNEAAAQPDVADQHEAWLGQTLARPLFSPDRRPVEVGVRGLPRLTGIVVAGSQRVAIFASPPGKRPIIVETGGRVGTYQIQAIADTEVTVSGPQGTTVVRPIFDAGAPPGPAPLPPRPQPGRPVAK